jgi:hypothetical protein
MAHFQRLLYEFVTRHSVDEFAYRPLPAACFADDIIAVATLATLATLATAAKAMNLLIAITAIALVAWFAAGTVLNVRRGRLTMAWMQDGLPAIGSRTTLRWLGSSAIELTIAEAAAPFTAATVVVFLEPRDVPWMWAIGHFRGRRDTVIIRGLLRKPPAAQCEALVPASWSGREAVHRVPKEWTSARSDAEGVVVHYADAEGLAIANVLLGIARGAGLDVTRLSLRRGEPQFQVHVALPDPGQHARAFFDAVRAMAEKVPS